jgi:hypothetical protein
MKNSSVPSPTNWPEEKRKKKRGGLRAIDAGTRYDISGQLRKLAREIERGEIGAATDFVGAIRTSGEGLNGTKIRAFHWGTGTIETAHYMTLVIKNRLEC